MNRRVLVWYVFFFMLGILLQVQIKTNPVWLWLILLLSGLIMFLYKNFSYVLTGTAAFFMIAFGGLWVQTELSSLATLPDQDSRIKGEAVVVSIPVIEEEIGKCLVLATAEEENKRVKYYLLYDAEKNLNYGSQIYFQGEFLEGRGYQNPGCFDYTNYLRAHKIFGTISTLYDGKLQIIQNKKAGFWLKAPLLLKMKLYEHLQVLPERLRSLVQGMVFGEKSYLSEEMLQVLQRSGLMHLFAVSGLHVAFLLGILMVLARLLKIPHGVKFFLSGLALYFYVVMANFSPSVVRASLMVFLGLLAWEIGRTKDFLTLLALAALLILLRRPLLIFDAGFQLSFAAVAGIFYLYPVFKSKFQNKSKIWQSFLVTAAAQIAVMPLLLYHFKIFSWAGLLLSGLFSWGVAAVIFLVLAAVVFLWIPVLSESFLFLAGQMAGGMYGLLEKINSWAGLSFYIKMPSLLLITGYYGFLFFYVWSQKKEYWRRKKMFLLLAVSLFFLPSFDRDLQVAFLDVGQGDGIVIKSPAGKYLVLDAGGKIGAGGDKVGELAVLPYLAAQGVNEIEFLINSHPDNDHIQGLFALLKFIPVRNLGIASVFSEEAKTIRLMRQAKEQEARIFLLEAGKKVCLEENLYLEIISPHKFDEFQGDINNNGLVFRLVYGETSFLFTGDIAEEAIETICLQENLQADVLKIPHHGSKYSFSPIFYQKVAPKAVVISVGENSFGHPAQDIIEYWYQNKVPLYRTDLDGAVIFKSDGSRITVDTFVKDRKEV